MLPFSMHAEIATRGYSANRDTVMLWDNFQRIDCDLFLILDAYTQNHVMKTVL